MDILTHVPFSYVFVSLYHAFFYFATFFRPRGAGYLPSLNKKKKYAYKRVTFTFNGKQYDAYGKTLREAHAKAAGKKLELENALTSSGGNMTVKQWALEWFDTYKALSVGEGQQKNYMSHINGVIIPTIGNRRLKDIKGINLYISVA